MEKIYAKVMIAILAMLAFIPMTSCSDNNSDDSALGNNTSIAGTWVEGDAVMVLGTDGSYRLDYNDKYGQVRYGTYSFNEYQRLLVLDVEENEGWNSAYQQTLIVQTLTSTKLVLLYTDGDVQGVYTRR